MPTKTVLVLGGGGAVGVAYHCGALRALEEITGLDPRDADLLIGTSSGAIMATEFALGRTVDDIAAEVHPEEPRERGLERAWRSPVDLARRTVGASYLVARIALARGWPLPEPPRWMQRALPGALFSVGDGDWGPIHYPEKWPDQALWLVTADLDGGGRRVVLDRDGVSGLPASLGTAVMASCAVPGVLPPVRVGGRRLIDGGLRSSTNLDLARGVDADVVVALAPMAFASDPGPSPLHMVGRRRFNARLEKESEAVRATGASVLVLRPGADELRLHSSNILSRDNGQAIIAAAYDATMARRDEIAALVRVDGARNRSA
ncbi:MAG TPA: patatin-like phospholipase family protein [Acidimicrobiales bacterium]|nr:patatin-like phospholipase family protein [Acidimicrobiales bacterium]